MTAKSISLVRVSPSLFKQPCQQTSPAMFSLLSLSSRVFQQSTWTRTAQSLWPYSRSASWISQETKSTTQDPQADQESMLDLLKKNDRNAYARWRYHNDDEYRKRKLESVVKYSRSSKGREKMKAIFRENNQKPATKQYQREYYAQSTRESLRFRRGRWLVAILQQSRWIKERWTWKLHVPVKTADRVDHHCTACDRNRFLRLWWATKVEPTTYMCNTCFASDFDLMVPEGQHKKLPRLFTDPSHPPPSKAS